MGIFDNQNKFEPTISNTLRSLTNGNTQTFDEQVVARNKEIMKKRNEKKKEKDRIIEKGQLTWSYFSDSKQNKEKEKENRQIFNKFKEIVLEMIGDDEIPSDEIASAVYETFMIVANPHKDKPSKCESLRQIFHSFFKVAMYNKLSDQVNLLLQIKNPFESDSKASNESVQTIDSFESMEWQLPSNYQLHFEDKDEMSIFDEINHFINTKINNNVDEQKEKEKEKLVNTPLSDMVLIHQPGQIKKSKKLKKLAAASTSGSNNLESSNVVVDGTYTIEWLREECSVISIGLGIPSEEIYNSIMSFLKNKKETIEEDMIGLLGFDHLELIADIIKYRDSILGSLVSGYRASNHSGPLNHFTIQTKDEKDFDKQLKKDDKKRYKNEQHQQHQEEQIKFIDHSQQPFEQPTIYNQKEFTGGDVCVDLPYGGKIALPKGTVRTEKTTHTEVMVPYSLAKPFADNEKLVEIEESIAEISRAAFGSIKKLNRIQSRVFESAYKSNENILISAPTGAGKTNIALLTILHEIESNINPYGYLDKDNFKIIYIAPLKALASEMVEKFSNSLKYLGIVSKELTGDMQLTQKELKETQIIVTTPEKWDVITRKSSDVALTKLVRLIIIDEIHLLHEERGPVLECIVARTLRQVETTQEMIRIVGLSATLPNYKDVARFIRAPASGTHFFDSSYRPVPLTQNFIGVKDNQGILVMKNNMNQLCYERLEKSLKEGHQVMIFVHSRKDTVKTAEIMNDMAKEKHFRFSNEEPSFGAKKEFEKVKSKEIRSLFQYGISVHHAGLLRSDRNVVEKYFANGTIKVLVCTATLAWGVNLPAHTVIIKGTQVYNAKNGGFMDLGISDVMQIFGRAGRPQFDSSGEGFLLTSKDRLDHYLTLMSSSMPIESKFITNLEDHLNAEIVLGTVSNVNEAVNWLSYTYLFIRMLQNPLAYGIPNSQRSKDPQLEEFKREIIIRAAKKLEQCKMTRFDEQSENLGMTELGRIASHYYIKHPSIETFNEMLNDQLGQDQILNILSNSSEFENITLREEESTELDKLAENQCYYELSVLDSHSKVKCLLQAFFSRANIDGFSLVSDSNYTVQNSSRILRGLFEISLKKGWCTVSKTILDLCKMVDHQLWHFESPLRQAKVLSLDTIRKIEERDWTPERICDMEIGELAFVLGNQLIAKTTRKIAQQFPKLDFEIQVQPITANIIRINMTLIPMFSWNDKMHGDSQPFWIWVQDNESQYIFHSEYFMLTKKIYNQTEPITLTCIIPLPNPMPSQFFLHYISDRWLGSEGIREISFRHLVLPQQDRVVNTELLDLQPLPKEALKNKDFESLFKFSHFNPIQTQVFHTLYYTNNNVLLGSPTGSGKTICAELAMFKVFRDEPHMKVVYIAPLKALVRERMNDWKVKFQEKLGKKLVELTGDYTPNMIALQNADIVTTTPEKWDGISRNWKNRSYVTSVSLLIIDEIHLIGELRGPILEVIVSRMKLISKQTGVNIRVVGLSTAMANAIDLSEWMGIDRVGLFNFRPSCRPVPIEVHIQGFQGKNYCPRMQTMNKPSFAAIATYSPKKPVLIFVSSRRQTRLTALDLISYLVVDNDPLQWIQKGFDIEPMLARVKDQHLRHTLSFGIGMHHAGLNDGDRTIVETLFGENKIQILISTSTLAWGVNLPAHLVIIKGTEYFDGKTKRYVDFPLTDVLQMIGRAGRPQFDKEGKAMVMVHEPKKQFYKKFLYDPFPVESHLKDFLHDHLNAEIVSGTIQSKQGAINYLVNTFFFRRLVVSPSYYGLEDNSVEAVNQYLSDLLDSTLADLEQSSCIEINEYDEIIPMSMGKIASFYYLNYKTVQNFSDNIKRDSDIKTLLRVLSDAAEYSEFPVRHNEEILNQELNENLPIKIGNYEDSHTKVHLLLQAHFQRCPLPITDFVTDTKSALDQGIRILQAMIDVSFEYGYFATAIQVIRLLQMLVQGRWDYDSSLMILPHINKEFADFLSSNLFLPNGEQISNLSDMLKISRDKIQSSLLNIGLSDSQIKETLNVIDHLPKVRIEHFINTNNINNDDNENENNNNNNKMKNNNSNNNNNNNSKSIVYSGQEFNIKIKVTRENKKFSNGHAFAPLYSKEKDEGWIMVLTNEKEQMIGFKRVPQMISNSVTANFKIPKAPFQSSTNYNVKLYSDTYMGLDYFHSFQVPIINKKQIRNDEDGDTIILLKAAGDMKK
ncbi:hypothetical protein ACTFIV_008206 [Dictyostelium citrinum]